MAKRKNGSAETLIPAVSPNRKTETSVANSFVTLYINNSHVEVSNWEVKLRVGLIRSATPDLVTVEEQAAIYMSHEHARAFHEAFAKSLSQLEALKNAVAARATKVQ